MRLEKCIVAPPPIFISLISHSLSIFGSLSRRADKESRSTCIPVMGVKSRGYGSDDMTKISHSCLSVSHTTAYTTSTLAC